MVVVLIAVSAAAGLGWMAGQRVKSPDQVALETEPPPPSLITVEVELTELAADVITRADVGYDDPALLSLSGALGGLPSVLLVTSAPERGTELVEGSVAIEISGRPVFLLVGEIPVFRDMRPKLVGPDVLQLEEALSRLGYLTDEPDDEWDHLTEAAVEAWYEASGYTPNGVSDEEESRLEVARDRVEAAEDQVRVAEDRVGTAMDRVEAAEDQVRVAEDRVGTAMDRVEAAEDQVRVAGDALSRAEDILKDAEKALVEAQEGPGELEIRRARSAVASTEEQLGFTEADAERGSADADRAVLEAEAAREQAARDYTIAESRWQSGQAGVHPDGGTLPSPVQMEGLRLAFESAAAKLEAAERAIGEVDAARDRKAVESGAALREARDRLAVVRATLDELLTPPDTSSQSRAVEDARSGLEDARFGVETARSGVEDARSGVEDARSGVETARSGVEDARSGVRDAESDLEDARSDLIEAQDALEKLESETGVWMPAGELIFLERLPVRVDLLTVERGSSVSGSFMTVTGSELAVRGSVLVRDVSLVKEGGEAWIDDSLLAAPLVGEIRLVEDRPGTRDVSNDRHYIEIVADGIPDELIGKNVKVVIPVGGTDGEVLAVPAAALSATADGSTRVEVEQPDGSTRFVRVEPGLAASGLVEITPLDGELKEGDLVVVGVASGDSDSGGGDIG